MGKEREFDRGGDVALIESSYHDRIRFWRGQIPLTIILGSIFVLIRTVLFMGEERRGEMYSQRSIRVYLMFLLEYVRLSIQISQHAGFLLRILRCVSN